MEYTERLQRSVIQTFGYKFTQQFNISSRK
jgi:hypothetical protein